MSDTVKMSLTRALREVGRLTSIIEKNSGKNFVAISIGKGAGAKLHRVYGPGSIEQMEREIQSNFDTIDQAIERRQLIKSLIIKANAATTITFMGKDITLAEAIEMKSSVTTKKNYLQVLRSSYLTASSTMHNVEVEVTNKIDTAINGLIGGDKTNLHPETLKNVSDQIRNTQGPALVDPMGIAARIKDLEEEIQQIENELDYLLTEVNSRTEIEVPN